MFQYVLVIAWVWGQFGINSPRFILKFFKIARTCSEGDLKLFRVIPSYSRLFQVIPGYSRLFQVIPGYSRLFQLIPGYSRLFQLIPGYSRLFQVIPAYSRLFRVLLHPHCLLVLVIAWVWGQFGINSPRFILKFFKIALTTFGRFEKLQNRTEGLFSQNCPK